MEALSVGDLEGFGDAIRQERALIEERAAALSDFAKQCHKRRGLVRERVQRRVEARGWTATS